MCDHSNHSHRHDRTHLIKVLNNTRTVIKTSLSTSFPCTCVYINKNNEITTTTTKKEIRTYNRTEHREEVQSEVRRPMCPLKLLHYIDVPFSVTEKMCRSLVNTLCKAYVYVLKESERERQIGCLRREEKLSGDNKT